MGADRLRVLAWPRSMAPDDNPYVGLLYDAMEQTGEVDVTPFDRRTLVGRRWDVVHVHWPEWAVRTDTLGHSALDIAKFTALLGTARSRGARLVWTAHDLRPHEAGSGGPMGRWMEAWVRQVDHVICLSKDSVGQVLDHYPVLRRAGVSVVPHGHYRGAYPDDGAGRAESRRRLGLPEGGRVLLLLGHLRPYKNAAELVGRFRRLAGPSDRLVVAGRPLDDELAAQVSAAAGGDGRVLLHLDTVDHEEVPTYLRSADVAVLPYRWILNSGAALLALSFDRPVVAPALGSFAELATTVGDDWVRLYEGELSDDVVLAALRSPLPSGPAPLDELGWGRLAGRTLAAYRQAVGRPRLDLASLKGSRR